MFKQMFLTMTLKELRNNENIIKKNHKKGRVFPHIARDTITTKILDLKWKSET